MLPTVPVRMHHDEVPIDVELVERLLAAQHPALLAGRALRLVEPWGTDNAIWRLGDDLVVRLPRIHWAVGQVELEATWLPRLAPHLRVAVPVPVAVGRPGEGFPHPWAVHRWLPGEQATPAGIADPGAFVDDLARVVLELRRVPVAGAPQARGRARPLEQYDAETRRAIERASHLVDADAALTVWEAGMAAAPHDGPPVWVHGDLEGNCLVVDGHLSGLVDWGSACAGDPAVDVQVAWSPLVAEEHRRRFLDLVAADDATAARAKAASVHQACAALPYYLDTYPQIVERARHKLDAVGVAVRLPPTSTAPSR